MSKFLEEGSEELQTPTEFIHVIEIKGEAVKEEEA